MSFESLGLRAELVRAVHEHGYQEPTPIQQRAIPAILAGEDLLGSAQTGTGKTAGFTLPILQRLHGPEPGRGRLPRALVLVPTRELALQVDDSIRVYGRHLALRSAAVFGGVNINPQKKRLAEGLDIVVATPGRLLDHLGQHTIDLSAIEILVLDEADRMLDMGFIRDIRKVLNILPAQKQVLLFSATYSSEIRELARGLLIDPVQVDVAPRNTAVDAVEQIIHPVDKTRKRALLSWLIGSGNWRQVLVFHRTKHGSNRLAEQLNKDGIPALAIHGNKSQGARTRALASFKAGEIRALVATDLAARGLDIKELPHVVNFELPNVPEDYVHRIGRTGRAGKGGSAISLVCAEEAKLLKDIERVIGRVLPRQAIAGFEPAEALPDDSPAPKSKPRKARSRRRKSAGRPVERRESRPSAGLAREHNV